MNLESELSPREGDVVQRVVFTCTEGFDAAPFTRKGLWHQLQSRFTGLVRRPSAAEFTAVFDALRAAGWLEWVGPDQWRRAPALAKGMPLGRYAVFLSPFFPFVRRGFLEHTREDNGRHLYSMATHDSSRLFAIPAEHILCVPDVPPEAECKWRREQLQARYDRAALQQNLILFMQARLPDPPADGGVEP